MISIVNLKKSISQDVNVYPNPVNDKLFIDLKNEKTLLKVFNINGEKVYEEQVKTIATSIDVCDWHKGYYIVVLENNHDFKSYKIEVN